MTRVFVAGATGAIGRVLVPRLVAAGHQVTGMTSRPEGVAEVTDLGGRGAIADALDPAEVEKAVRDAEPEVVIHQLTRIPKAMNPRRVKQEFAVNNRLRIEGTRNLIEAARAAGTRRVIAQSIAFVYAPEGPGSPRTEDEPIWPNPPGPAVELVDAVRSLERQVLDGPEGVVLRYGFFYGPGTSYAVGGTFADMVRARRLPIVGKGEGRWSFVHVADAAGATIAAMHGPTGIFNVVDDEPAAEKDWLPVYAESLGAPAPRRAPRWLARIAAGPYVAALGDMRGASNAKAREQLGWAPAHASWRTGFVEANG